MAAPEHSTAKADVADKPTLFQIIRGVATIILLAIAIFLSTQIIADTIFTILAMVVGGETAESVGKTGSVLFSLPYTFGRAALFYVLMIGAIVWLLKFRRQPLASIGLKKPRSQDLGYAIVGYGLYLLTMFTVRIILAETSPDILNPKQQLGFDRASEGLVLIPIFVCLTLLPAIAEEMLARGWLFSGLRKRLKFWIATLITSLLFATPHLAGGGPGLWLWIAAIDTFVLSLYLCYLRERTGRLWAPILLHGIKNGVAFYVLFISTSNLR